MTEIDYLERSINIALVDRPYRTGDGQFSPFVTILACGYIINMYSDFGISVDDHRLPFISRPPSDNSSEISVV
jgi:hypothetical protein